MPTLEERERIVDEITQVAFTAYSVGATANEPGDVVARLREMARECADRIAALRPAPSGADVQEPSEYPPLDANEVVSREDDLAFRVAVQECDRRFEADGAAGTKTWFRDYFVPELARGGFRIRRALSSEGAPPEDDDTASVYYERGWEAGFDAGRDPAAAPVPSEGLRAHFEQRLDQLINQAIERRGNPEGLRASRDAAADVLLALVLASEYAVGGPEGQDTP